MSTSTTVRKPPARRATPARYTQRLKWHHSSSKAFRGAELAGADSPAWNAWQAHLGKRRRPSRLIDLVESKGSPILWGLSAESVPAETLALVQQLYRFDRSRQGGLEEIVAELKERLAAGSNAPLDLAAAVENLAWLSALPSLAKGISAELWWSLWDQLLEAATGDADVDLTQSPPQQQLVSGELALGLAYQFPEIDSCRRLAAPARRALNLGLTHLLDGEGLPHSRDARLLRPLLACWTRSAALAEHTTGAAWNERMLKRYRRAVHEALRFSRANGTPVLARDDASPWAPDFRRAALRRSDDPTVSQIANWALGDRLPKSKSKSNGQAALARVPKSACHSEWAKTAMLRTRWARSAESLTVTFDEADMRSELAARGEVIWSGDWPVSVDFNGKRARPVSDWDSVCWVSDRDADYLELQIELEHGLSVERHIILAREDRFLLIADAVLGKKPGRIQYETTFPVTSNISVDTQKETSELSLRGDSNLALAMPLALSEWRGASREGSLRADQQGVSLRHSTQGSALFVPLFIDLNPRRLGREITWRQLTVAENRHILPSNEAVGYRVQAGSGQWLIYRSLIKPSNRTILGHNLTTEFLVARFGRDGLVTPLLEIE